MHDPYTLIGSWGPFNLWHVDPERKGDDDSCGWFKRARHGDPKVVERIEKRIEFNWDRTFKSEESGNVYFCGLFCPNGDPHLSVHAIALNLFQDGAWEYFNDGKDPAKAWRKSKRFIKKHLAEILLFAENPTDSLHDGITMKYGGGENRRSERIHQMATCIYGWILRAEQKWWQHPRWHISHWRLHCRWTNAFKRWAFSRCCKCKKRFRWGYSPVTNNWNAKGPRWFRSETDVYHSDCNRAGSNGVCGA